MTGYVPLLKWAGGKRWFVPYVGRKISDLLGGRRMFYEPFAGAGAMSIALGGRVYMNDVNWPLINFHSSVQREPLAVFEATQRLVAEGTDKDAYYEVRRRFIDLPAGRDPFIAAGMFLYLNRLCFNGLFRVNAYGVFNTPYGDGRFRFPTLDQMQQVSSALSGASFSSGDFEDVIDLASDGALVYADPVYDGTYAGYTSGCFDDEDQRRLGRALRRASERGAFILAHNAHTQLVSEIYGSWATVLPVWERRAINSDPNGRAAKKCVVITNAPAIFDVRKQQEAA